MVEDGPKGLRIAAVNPPARALGVTEGLSFTDARARAPQLEHEDIDRAADAQALAALAEWMMRWVPLVALHGEDAMILETTGCDHLYGGEADMAAAISAKMTASGFAHCIALASTPGAAFGLAHDPARSEAPFICAPGREKADLAGAPVTALRLSADASQLLRRFGLTRIGQLYTVDRKSLARRFNSREAADAVLLRLDQVLGLKTEPLDYVYPAPDYAVRLPCPEPLGDLEGVKEGLTRLMAKLTAELAGHGLGARLFDLRAFRSDGSVVSLSVSAARAVRDPAHIHRLFRDRLETLDPGFGIDLLLLEARRTSPMAESSPPLSGDLAGEGADEAALSRLADRIVAKLGEGAVTVSAPFESHLPERAERRLPYRGSLPDWRGQTAETGLRPLRLFNQPEPVDVMAEVPEGPPLRFVWRRVVRKVTRADGPERIAPEWWLSLAAPSSAASLKGATLDWLSPKMDPRADAAQIEKIRTQLQEDARAETRQALPRARDYYRVEDDTGRRYWLFRDGLYGDERGGTPRWFMHGLFS